MTMRGPRLPVGSRAWIGEERESALRMVQSEVEEFSFSARNDFEWLNDHMAGIFDENEVNVADIFKTPGKLRGRTPMTTRRLIPPESRVPLSDVFSATPKTATATANTFSKQLSRLQSPKTMIHRDSPSPSKHAPFLDSSQCPPPQPTAAPVERVAPLADSGYHGSLSEDLAAAAVTRSHPLTESETPAEETEADSAVETEVEDEPEAEADTESESGDKAGDDDTAEDGAEDGAEDEVADQVEDGPEDGVEDGAEDGAEDGGETIPSSAHESPVTPHHLESRPAPSPEATFQSAQAEPVSNGPPDATQTPAGPPPPGIPLNQPAVGSVRSSPAQSPVRSPARASSPIPSPLAEASPQRPRSSEQCITSTPPCPTPGRDPSDDEGGQRDEDSESPADTSSPIGPIARKSSLSFAPLPPREPLATDQGLDARMPRASHLEQQRTGDYGGMPTGGMSLGNPDARAEEDGAHDEMDVDEPDVPSSEPDTDLAVNHNKTYTQQLQDRISLLGQTSSNTGRASRSIASLVRLSSAPASRAVKLDDPRGDTNAISLSPARKRTMPTTPGAFPSEGDDEDDEDFNEDDFIVSPAVMRQPEPSSPRPILPKSYSADVVVGVAGHGATIGRNLSTSPMTPSQPPPVPEKDKTPAVQGKAGLGPVPLDLESRLANHRLPVSPIKGISVSNLPWSDVLEDGDKPGTPTTPRSPTRTIRDSPLKQVRNKLTSILKSSKGLLASSAALSAEGKSSLLSPSRPDLRFPPSTESLVYPASVTEPTYPDPGGQAGAAEPPQSPTRMASPGRPVRKTRASAEREREEKRKEKEAHRLAEQMDKLEKAREREREKARLFGGEKDRQKTERQQQQAGSPTREAPKPTSTSPTKAKHSDEADNDGSANNDIGSKSTESRTERHEDNDDDSDHDDGNNEHDHDAAADDDDGDADDLIMEDAPAAAAPSVTRPTNAPTHHPSRSREIKRPIKPTKDMAAKSRQAPTVIRVNTGSQHPQFRPSNSTLAANLHETFGPPSNPQATPQINRTVGGQSTLKTKVSAQSLKSSVSSVGRPKALDIAAKRKEQEERETQRRREAKLEMDRKRAAIQEEERRQDQERRQEAERAERQKQREREEAAEARRNAQRQAALEKAKQSRAPPPVARAHPTGPPEYGPGGGGGIINGQRDISRPPSRMNTDQQQHSRPVNAVLSSSAVAAAAAANKSAHKRPLQHDGGGGGDSQSRGAKDAKRRRTGDDGSDGDGEAAEALRNIKGPPVRPSGGLKKELPTKSAFPIRFSNQAQSRDVFKSLGQAKAAAHPLDMAQLSKAAIPFAANSKTPAAAAAKPTAPRPSPKFPNGDSIELPEIHTDDDDDEDDDEEEYGDGNGGGGGGGAGAGAGGAKRPSAIAPWADSPDLRRALMMQETIDPHQIFGPPAPLMMEEVFSKSKDRWHKFRARTSSANWSGADRLTEEEIRRDLQARDKLRRDGGWSYEMGKDMV